MERNWEEVLHLLYVSEEEWIRFSKAGGVTPDHPIVENTDLSFSEVQAALSFLEQHDLVSQREDGFYLLEPKGFEVAASREEKRSQNRIQAIIMALTVILSVGALAQVAQLFVQAGVQPGILYTLLPLLFGIGGYKFRDWFSFFS
ncbi:hypothetical protein EXE43_22545 [Halorubrum sp. SS5]|nr:MULTISPECIES: hypothetical protein [unclassified Halorubrum]TKX54250.1 hypothetical protein EXE44_16940 [Halorubrum sp. SS7]TKX54484.1 hypothetical protein EXE42_08315 [Halorubrum sp. SP3]TKX70809.1 hypothetical protein EXE45_03250 [Halorubrum sp. SP9]TKX83764.1 hypothetical protein EXE43_22545 [Halorubrum sp. SS5]